MLSKIYFWMRIRAKPYGFNEYLPKLLSESETRKIQLLCRAKVDQLIGDPWFNIFEWIYYHHISDTVLLQRYWQDRLIGIFDYYISRLLRTSIVIIDATRIFFYIRRRYCILVKKTGKSTSNKALLIYTKNKRREQLYDHANKYIIFDYLVSQYSVVGFEYISEIRIKLSDIISVLGLKLRYFYVSVDVIFEVYAAEHLLARAIADAKASHLNVCALVREGGTPINRIFLKVAKENNIKRTVVFTSNIISTWTSVPPDIDRVVVNSGAGITNNMFLRGRTLLELHTNPYLRWQKIANSSIDLETVGFIVGDEIYRYKEQACIDRDLLDAMERMGVKRCLMRPHPQELTRPTRVRYYQNLIVRYPFLELNSDERADDFLEKISILIAYVKSTIVEEALLCRRPVLIYCRDQHEPPNREIIQMASGLGQYFSSIDVFEGYITQHYKNSREEFNTNWLNHLDRLGFDPEEHMTIDALLDRVF